MVRVIKEKVNNKFIVYYSPRGWVAIKDIEKNSWLTAHNSFFKLIMKTIRKNEKFIDQLEELIKIKS